VAWRTVAVAPITIVTGFGPQRNLMMPPSATARTTAADVQLAGVPWPIQWFAWLVLTARPAGGTATCPDGLPKLGSAPGLLTADELTEVVDGAPAGADGAPVAAAPIRPPAPIIAASKPPISPIDRMTPHANGPAHDHTVKSESERVARGRSRMTFSRGRWFAVASYETVIDMLEAELEAVSAAFEGLAADAWARPTRLVPVDPDLPKWTVLELAGHFDISIGLTRMLISGKEDAQPARDSTSFFINPRSETGPVVYSYAYTMVEGKTPDDMPGVLKETFARTISEARAVPADLVGPGYFAPMRVDEFVYSRILEAVVHGIDLAQAVNGPIFATPDGITATAAILDDLLARRTRGTRPAALKDDLAWILAASGRSESDDNRLPLIG
jgi:Mycothiol maleylpyruvate isomerase N-terminal domain